MEAQATADLPKKLQIWKEPRRYSLEQYLRKEERSEERHEFLDGTIKKMPMSRGPHNLISANVIGAFARLFSEKKDRQFLVFSGQQKIYLPKLNHGRYPDALVVAEVPVFWDDNEVLLINPILIVEVASKSTRDFDQAGKFFEYKTLDSFQEYLLIEPDSCRVESRFREEPGLWRDTVLEDLSGDILLKSVDVRLPISDVYRNVVLGK